MAKKEEAPNMVEQFLQFRETKGIDINTLQSVLEDSFRKVLENMFGTDENLKVILNPDKGDVQILQNLTVVPDGQVQNPNLEISLSDAQADNDPDAEVGEEHTKEIIFADFGRRAILNLRQTLASKILELQKESLYNRYKDLVGTLVSGEVYQAWSKETLLCDDDKNEMTLPKSESIPGEFFHKGDTVRAVIERVDNKNNNPKITVSRTSPNFLRRLFEIEVPEIHEGLISIRALARIPGERAKVAVESYDDRIDPVGACVGPRGTRIHGIVRELHSENIDVINYTKDPDLFIQRALQPAKISQIRVDTEEKRAEVFLKPDQVSVAIGKNGSNIKVASMLTGYQIDVYRDAEAAYEDDIYLDEFNDEIDQWVIDTLKDAGYVTAKSVLNAKREELIEKTDLEDESIDDVITVLKNEYEDE